LYGLSAGAALALGLAATQSILARQSEHDGEKYFAKLNYYAAQAGSEDPSDPCKTVRVLTVMRADPHLDPTRPLRMAIAHRSIRAGGEEQSSKRAMFNRVN